MGEWAGGKEVTDSEIIRPSGNSGRPFILWGGKAQLYDRSVTVRVNRSRVSSTRRTGASGKGANSIQRYLSHRYKLKSFLRPFPPLSLASSFFSLPPKLTEQLKPNATLLVLAWNRRYSLIFH